MKADADYWKGFWAGRAIAVRLAGLGMEVSDWYLYNGVRLPKLPEWDKTVYPYAVVLYVNSTGKSGGYWFAPIDYERSCTTSGLMRGFAGYLQYQCKTDSNTWVLSEMSTLVSPLVRWANYNVLDTFGDLYLPASEPIPTT